MGLLAFLVMCLTYLYLGSLRLFVMPDSHLNAVILQ